MKKLHDLTKQVVDEYLRETAAFALTQKFDAQNCTSISTEKDANILVKDFRKIVNQGSTMPYERLVLFAIYQSLGLWPDQQAKVSNFLFF